MTVPGGRIWPALLQKLSVTTSHNISSGLILTGDQTRSWTRTMTLQPAAYWLSRYYPGINLLKPSGFFTFDHVEHPKILHGARFALSVLYGYQNRQRLLFYTSLTDWFL